MTRIRKRNYFIGAIITVGALALAGCASGAAQEDPDTPSEQSVIGVNEELRKLLPQEVLDSGELIVGSPLTSPPVIFVEDGGAPTGAAYDVSQAIGEVLGVEVRWEELAFPGVIPGLQAGNIDISMGVIAATVERQEILDMVMLFQNESALLTQKGNPQNVTDLEEACGLTLGGLAGSHQLTRIAAFSDECVARGELPIVINEYPSQGEGQAAVQSERIAAFFGPYVSLNHVALTAGGGDIFELGDGLYPDNAFGIAVQKDRGDLAEALRGALLELEENGIYQEILDKYDSGFAALSNEQIVVNGAGTELFPM